MANLIPLILGVGAVALVFGSKKKSGGTKLGTKEPVAASGSMNGYDWQVQESTKGEGFATSYLASFRKTGSNAWNKLDFRDTIEDATLIAKEAILAAVTGELEKEFNWGPAMGVNTDRLRKDFPGTSLDIVERGKMMRDGGVCQWAIAAVSPPIAPGAYAGFVICPSAQEEDSGFGDSIAAIKTHLGIA